MSLKDLFKRNRADDNDDRDEFDDLYYGEEESKSRGKRNDRSDYRDEEDDDESYSPRRSRAARRDEEDDDESYSPRRSRAARRDEEDDDESYSPRRSRAARHDDGEDDEVYSPRRSVRTVRHDDDEDGYYAPVARPAGKPADTYEEPAYNGGRERVSPDSRLDSADDSYYSPVYTRTAAPAPAPAPEPAPQPEPAPAEDAVVEAVTPVNAGTLYFLPETYTEDRDSIVWGLREGHVVVISVSRLDRTSLVRLVDFITGAKTALDADMFRLDQTTVVLTPAGVEVDPAEIEFPETEDVDADADGEIAVETVSDDEGEDN